MALTGWVLTGRSCCMQQDRPVNLSSVHLLDKMKIICFCSSQRFRSDLEKFIKEFNKIAKSKVVLLLF